MIAVVAVLISLFHHILVVIVVVFIYHFNNEFFGSSMFATAPTSMWALDADNVDGVCYHLVWDRARRPVTARRSGMTGWIQMVAAYQGHNQVEVPPHRTGRTPFRAHLCAEFPCEAR